MLVRYMDSTFKISSFSGQLLASDDLLFALELAEAWYTMTNPGRGFASPRHRLDPIQ